MFDLFGENLVEHCNQLSKTQAVNYVALALLLIEKGVITEGELLRARARATHQVDQIFAEKQAEADREFSEKYPSFAKLIGGLKKDEL